MSIRTDQSDLQDERHNDYCCDYPDFASAEHFKLPPSGLK
jgi:hypothetical protein